MNANAEVVREALTHPQIESEWPAEIDRDVALAALDALVAERDKANADWHRMRDLHADALTEVKRLREAASWLIDNRGHRGEEQAWKLLADALAKDTPDPRNQDDNPHPD